MFNQKRYFNLQRQQQPTILAKANTSYRRLEKAMKEAPEEYDQIKKLVEEKTDANMLNHIALKKSNINPTKNVQIMTNRKINNKSKKYKI